VNAQPREIIDMKLNTVSTLHPSFLKRLEADAIPSGTRHEIEFVDLPEPVLRKRAAQKGEDVSATDATDEGAKQRQKVARHSDETEEDEEANNGAEQTRPDVRLLDDAKKVLLVDPVELRRTVGLS